MVSFSSPLRGDVSTLAEILKARGWQTAAFGSSPEFQWFSALASSFSRGFDVFPERLSGIDSIEDQALRARGGNPVSEALAWLRDERDRQKPFFLWIPIGSAHWPYGQDFPRVFGDTRYEGYFKRAPSNWQTYGMIYENGRYEAGTVTEVVKGVLSMNYDTNVSPQRVEELQPEDLAYVRDRYDDGLFAADRMLEKLFAYLEEADLDTRTVVVIQSEHGEGFGDHGYVGHYDIMDTEVRVPLIISIPGVSPRREEGLISGVDVAPTVLAAVGVSHDIMDGVDFFPYLRGATTTPPRQEVFLTRVPLWESVLSYAFGDRGREFRSLDDVHRYRDSAVRTNEWKLIHRLSREEQQRYSWWGWVSGNPVQFPEYQLYNVLEDRGETTDRFTDPAFTSVAQALMEKLHMWERQWEGAGEGAQGGATMQEYY